MSMNGVKYAVKELEKQRIIDQLLGGYKDKKKERYDTMIKREIEVSERVYDIRYCINFFKCFSEKGKEYFIYENATGGNLT